MYRIDVYKDATSPALIARLYCKPEEVKTTAKAFNQYYVTVNRVKEWKTYEFWRTQKENTWKL